MNVSIKIVENLAKGDIVFSFNNTEAMLEKAIEAQEQLTIESFALTGGLAVVTPMFEYDETEAHNFVHTVVAKGDADFDGYLIIS